MRHRAQEISPNTARCYHAGVVSRVPVHHCNDTTAGHQGCSGIANRYDAVRYTWAVNLSQRGLLFIHTPSETRDAPIWFTKSLENSGRPREDQNEYEATLPAKGNFLIRASLLTINANSAADGFEEVIAFIVDQDKGRGSRRHRSSRWLPCRAPGTQPTSTLRMFSFARIAAGPPMLPR